MKPQNLRVKLGFQAAQGLQVVRGYMTLINASSESELPTLIFTPQPTTEDYLDRACTHVASVTDPKILDPFDLPASEPVPPATAPSLELSEPELQMNDVQFDQEHYELLLPVDGETTQERVIRLMRWIKARIEFARQSKVCIGRGLGIMLRSWTSEELGIFVELAFTEEFVSVEMSELKDFVMESDLFYQKMRQEEYDDKKRDESA